MDTHTRTRLSKLVGIIAAAMAFMALAMIPSQANPSHDPATESAVTTVRCDDVWCRDSRSSSDPDDDGGVWAITTIYLRSEPSEAYRAEFLPFGETLYVTDDAPDGNVARAYVTVFDRSGRIVDHDAFSVHGGTDSFNLGTPDGTGDIPEGYRLAFRVCMGSSTACSPMVWAVA